MSNSGQNPLTYMDGVSVKIAENYKPPKRIPMVMSYSQRVALNKLIQEPVLTYDFSREESVKCKMYEWKKARTAVIEQRKQRLNQLTQAMNTKSWESNENTSNKEVLDSNESIKPESTDNNQDNSNDLRIASDSYYQTESGILIPKIFNTPQQFKMLTPTPLANPYIHSAETREFKNYSLNKNPINYSEFESDTSPFDNMELKIINDLEELAQVLKYDSDDNVTNHSLGTNHLKTYVTTCPKTHKLMNTYVSDNIYSNLDKRMPNYGLESSINSKKFPVNGYYYDYSQNALTTQMVTKDPTIRSVPEIMKSLQDDLENTRLMSETNSKATTSSESASIPAILNNEVVDDPLKNLSPDLQKMAITISYMGFPLSRVARACHLLEGNQKKIVEHLLAMSDLLDLGFPEEMVATALIKCENDRDKALDLLIT